MDIIDEIVPRIDATQERSTKFSQTFFSEIGKQSYHLFVSIPAYLDEVLFRFVLRSNFLLL